MKHKDPLNHNTLEQLNMGPLHDHYFQASMFCSTFAIEHEMRGPCRTEFLECLPVKR